MIAMTTKQAVTPIIAPSPSVDQMSHMIAKPNMRYKNVIFGTMHDEHKKHNQPNASCLQSPGRSGSEFYGLVSDQSGQTYREQDAANMPIMAKKLQQHRGIH